MAHRGEVVDLVGPDGLHQPAQAAGVGEVAVVEHEPVVAEEMVDPGAGEDRGAPHQTVDLVPLPDQQIG